MFTEITEPHPLSTGEADEGVGRGRAGLPTDQACGPRDQCSLRSLGPAAQHGNEAHAFKSHNKTQGSKWS